MNPPADRAGHALRRRHVAGFEQLLAEHVARIDWSWDQLRAERLRALRELLSVAVQRSPWHRDRLAGLDVGRLSEADVESLPAMTKADLMVNFDDIVTDRRVTRALCEAHLQEATGPGYMLDEYSVVASGGSSGQRGVFVYGWDAWAICYASIVRFQHRDWARDPSLAGVPRVTAVVAASNATHLSAAITRTFSAPHNPRQLFPVSQPMERIVAGLNDLQPTVLMCYSSFLPHLAAEARAGRLAISPRRVIAISEPLLPEVRATAATVWGAPVANGYGMSEGLFAGSCAFGIHLPDDLCLIERVDAGGRPAAPGSPSQRIYLTNLYNHALPLIRFEVTDELSEPEASCPCGSALRRIQDPQGRLDDTFLYDGGTSVHPHVFRTALGRHSQILEYQVRQTARGADIQLIAPAGLDTLTLQHTIGQLLAAVGLHEAAVTVTLAAALDRQASGKLKRFVPLSA